MDANINLNVECGGIRVNRTYTRSADHPNPYQPAAIPAAKAGSLTTRTSDTAGVVTCSPGHGLTTGMIVDVYWAAGVRYGVAITVATNAVTLADGDHTAGAVLPAQATAVVLCQQVEIATAIDGDNASVFLASLEYDAVSAAYGGHIHFCESDDSSVADFDLAADKPLFVDLDQDIANPLTGDPIAVCYASHSDTTQAATLKIVTLEDSTP
jgi:hypothetical protein